MDVAKKISDTHTQVATEDTEVRYTDHRRRGIASPGPRVRRCAMPPRQPVAASSKKKKRAGKSQGGVRTPYHWSTAEHQSFLDALEFFGASSPSAGGAGHRSGVGKVPVGLGPGVAELISGRVGTRSVSQVPPNKHGTSQ